MKASTKAVFAVAGGAVPALFALSFLLDYFPGGLPSSYRARDHDLRLSPVAREALPVIDAIDRFYFAHGRCPRAEDGDLQELRASATKAGFTATPREQQIWFRVPGAGDDWIYSYSVADPKDCQLWRKLGWDPALIWLRHHEGAKWIFVPGDGSAEHTVKLDGP